MKLLLDTHTFIWWDSEPTKLSSRVLALCQDRQNVLLLSVVSVWEMQIKLQLGKLRALENLPAHHKDPFDRLLVAQALVEEAVLVSADPNIAKYVVQVVW